MSSDQAQTEASRMLVKTMYESSLSGNTQVFLNCLDENLVVLEPSFLPYGGRYAGLAGFRALFGEVAKYLDLASVKLLSLVADGDVVVAFLSVKTVKDGSELQLAERSLIRNGKVVEMKVMCHDLGSLISDIKR